MEIKPEWIFIGILILVPAQWFLSPSETGHLKYHLNSFLTTFKTYLPSFLEAPQPTDEELVEIEEMKMEADPKKGQGFGMGKYIRQRSPEMEFRVGDIVSHKVQDYRGVIIGWDPEAIATEAFIKHVYEGKEHLINQHTYAILIDTRDRLTPQVGYVSQENLQIEKGTVLHPLVEKFFDGFDEKRQKYMLRPLYRKYYPDD
ncbi:hypothetical protein CAEBREN_02906 [Caenorhabditis brenneri]|uniref:Hemimethylated DNA-binding domain-containing protein n=1 Tax=Caenorhabditis brenneri TaxID=135651 RepID=G0P1Z3_CAEBE|nr:hypothetical protein CAEBREN_02906 [Caenorhabditis brenneri]